MLSLSDPSYEQLQLVMSYDTDCTYKLRCLPGIITKRYMNRYLFKGAPYSYLLDALGSLEQVENEVCVTRVKFPLYERQIFDLLGYFEQQGEQNTFAELSTHAKYVAHTKIGRSGKLYSYAITRDLVFQCVDESLQKLAIEVMTENHHLTLLETITAQTLHLFGYTKKHELNN